MHENESRWRTKKQSVLKTRASKNSPGEVCRCTPTQRRMERTRRTKSRGGLQIAKVPMPGSIPFLGISTKPSLHQSKATAPTSCSTSHLSVSDTDHVGGDVSGHITGLGLDDGEGGERSVARRVTQLGGALEQPRVEVKHISGVGLTARGTAQQQGHLLVGEQKTGESLRPRHAFVGTRLCNRTNLLDYLRTQNFAERIYGGEGVGEDTPEAKTFDERSQTVDSGCQYGCWKSLA